jgi:hypothetical protein
MSAVAAGSASAETELHQWLIGGHLLASPVLLHSLGLLLLTDHSPTGGEVVVHCHGFDHGTVGPHGLDLVLAITTALLSGSDKIPCTFDKSGLCKSDVTPLALALNLPWLTHLLLDNGRVRDRTLGDGNGLPGWHVICTNIIGGESKDACIAESPGGSPLLENVAEGVEAKFDGESGNAECSLNGGAFRKGAGLVRGLTLFENPSATEKLTFAFA